MNQKIDWQLFNNDKLIINEENVTGIYSYNSFITYEKENEHNHYDFKNNTYTRKTNEVFMQIDFNNKTCKFEFPEEGNCTFDIKCSSNIKDDRIILEYSIDDEEKKIVIELKDIKL